MKIMSLDCKGEKSLVSKSSIGEVWNCRCCDTYLLNLGKITYYLSSVDVVVLAEMLIEALEHDAIFNFHEKELRGENA